MSERIFENLQTYLSQNSANFKVVEHEAAGSSESVAKARGTHLGQGAKALVCCIKGVNITQKDGKDVLKVGENELDMSCITPQNLCLDSKKPSARNGRIYVLAVFPADHKANLSALAAALGGTKASLTSEDECAALTDCVIGSIPPFSFHNRLLLVCDEKLFGRFDEIAFNAGLLDRSIILNADDYARAAKPHIINFATLS